MSQNRILNPEVILTTSSDARFPGSHAVDGKAHTFFLTTGSYPQEMIIAFPGGSEAQISKILLRTNGVKALRIDRTSESTPTRFSALVDCELAEKPNGFQVEQFQINKSTAGKDIRLLKIVILSGYEQFSCIKEFTIEGEGASPPPEPVVAAATPAPTATVRQLDQPPVQQQRKPPEQPQQQQQQQTPAAHEEQKQQHAPPPTRVLSVPEAPPNVEAAGDGGEGVLMGDLAEETSSSASSSKSNSRRSSSNVGGGLVGLGGSRRTSAVATTETRRSSGAAAVVAAAPTAVALPPPPVTKRKPNPMGLSLDVEDAEEPPQTKSREEVVDGMIAAMAARPTVTGGGTVTTGRVVVSTTGVTLGGNTMALDPDDLDAEGAAGELGRGSSGSVRRVKHRQTGMVMALKEIKVNNEHHLIEIQKELETLHGGDGQGSSQHPNLIAFYGAYSKEGSVYIAMECMDGSLAAFRNVPETVLAKMTRQMLEGFVYLHGSRQLIHRDIKPGNVLYNNSGEVKITDFGVSSSVDNTAGQAHSFVGTVTYMSPERLNGDAHGAAGDIWSLGITICELALGTHPYQGMMVNAKGEQNQAKFWSLISHMNSGEQTLSMPDNSSTQFKEFIGRCCDKDPTSRSDAAELLQHPWVTTNSSGDPAADLAQVRDYILSVNATKAEHQAEGAEAGDGGGAGPAPHGREGTRAEAERKDAKLASALDGLTALA